MSEKNKNNQIEESNKNVQENKVEEVKESVLEGTVEESSQEAGQKRENAEKKESWEDNPLPPRGDGRKFS